MAVISIVINFQALYADGPHAGGASIRVAVPSHIITLWPLLSSVLFISIKSVLGKFVWLFYVPSL